MTQNYGTSSKYGIITEPSLPDPDRINEKPLTPDQELVMEATGMPAEELKEPISIARQYRLGKFSAPLTRYEQRIAHRKELLVGEVKSGIYLFENILPRVNNTEHSRILEETVRKLHSELEPQI